MRVDLVLLSVMLALPGCLFAGLDRPNPANCTNSGISCPQGQRCDLRTQVCMAATPCTFHRDCTDSQTCDADGESAGQCVPRDEVIYVDAGHCPSSGADGSLERPFCGLSEGVVSATGSRGTLRVFAAASKYTMPPLFDAHLRFFGADRDPAASSPEDAPTLAASEGRDTVSVNGQGAITLDGFEIEVSRAKFMDRAAAGVACSGEATVTLRRAHVYAESGTGDNFSTGVHVVGCKYAGDRDQLSGLGADGLDLAGSDGYRVTNHFIFSVSGTAAKLGGGGGFLYNTIGASEVAGVDCGGGAALSDSIVLGDKKKVFAGACTFTDVVTTTGLDIAGLIPSDLTLVQMMDRATLSGDKSVLKTGQGAASVIANDFYGHARPAGHYDIGAEQFTQ